MVKVELSDGRWVALKQNGGFEGGQLTNRISAAEREAFARSLEQAYGDRLSHASIVNRHVRDAIWLLCALCISLALFLIVVAILVAMGVI